MKPMTSICNNSHVFRTEPVLGIESVKESGRIYGYASVFNVLDSQHDITRPGAFRDLNTDLIAFLWSHCDKEPIGKILNAGEDGKGVYFEAQLCFEVKRARELYVMLKEGVFTGVSIGWIPFDVSVNTEIGSRDINSGRIFEISLVLVPANDEARVTYVKHGSKEFSDDLYLARALNRACETLRH